MSFIEDNQAVEGCIFCDALQANDDAGNLIVTRGPRTFVILNLYPYTSGHLMVVPYDHVSSLEQLDANTQAELIHGVSHAVEVLRGTYKAESFNVGINIGEPAGAGVADHIHIHVVPRWPGDTSFMTTTGQARVIPEALEATYKRIRSGWEDIGPRSSLD
jgi:ATP adenylyltransferase